MCERETKLQKISVIVPAYNVEPFLEKCMRTILNQTYSNLEIILVDDGSTDGTGSMCDKIAQEDPRIIVLHKENGGLSDARNAGLQICTGDFISFIDSDDYIEPDMYECMMEEMKDESASMVAVGFIMTEADGSTRILGAKQRKKLTREGAFMNLFEEEEMFPSSVNKLYRSYLFEKLRFRKGIINEDTELIPKLLNICNSVIILDKALYHYVLRKGSITQSEFAVRDYEGIAVYATAIEVCKSHYPKILPFASYYELSRIYETYVKLAKSKNRRSLWRQEVSLRFKIAGKTARCLRWKQIRNKYGRELQIYIVAVIIGYPLTYRLMMMNRKGKK